MFIPKSNINLNDEQKKKMPQLIDRLKYFASLGYYFTDVNSENTMDNVEPGDTIIYPIFMVDNEGPKNKNNYLNFKNGYNAEYDKNVPYNYNNIKRYVAKRIRNDINTPIQSNYNHLYSNYKISSLKIPIIECTEEIFNDNYKGNSYTPKELAKLPKELNLRTPTERIKYFIEKGYYFSNVDITESRDHIVDNEEYVYPLFRNDYINTNRTPWDYINTYLISETGLNNEYGYQMMLNKYAIRQAARRISYNEYIKIEENFVYAYYLPKNTSLGNFSYPVQGITKDEFQAGYTYNEMIELLLKKYANDVITDLGFPVSLKLSVEIAALGIGSFVIAGGTLYITSNVSTAAIVLLVSLLLGGVVVILYNGEEIKNIIYSDNRSPQQKIKDIKNKQIEN